MNTDNFKTYLKSNFPDDKFYNAFINKSEKCIGLYLKQGLGSGISLGGKSCTTIGSISFSILIHWDDDASACESKANLIYDSLFGQYNLVMDGINVISVELEDGHPISMERDSGNNCESVIRVIIYYEK